MTSFDFNRVLTTGANGMIGSYVDFGTRTDRAELDILDGDAVMAYVKKNSPRAILHLAGATDMARCEQDSIYAYELNVRGTYNVARAAREIGAVLAYASTSRIFKGDKDAPYAEDDTPAPTTQYGRTKHMGELIAAALVPRHIIARTSWVFGGGPERDNKFYGKIMNQLKSGTPEIAALDDVHGSPTYGKDYVATIKNLLEKEESGTFHIANAGMATRFDLARAMAAQLRPDVTVRAVDRSHFASGSTLPVNESITSNRCILRPWQEALAEYLAEEWAPQQ
jgi:dTDP-4-dehydrorhamnose reductase